MFWKSNKKNNRIYLDHAATTPMDSFVLKNYSENIKTYYSNPGGLHANAVESYKALGEARSRIASQLSIQQKHVYFARGGTEAVNMSLYAIAQSYFNLLGESSTKKVHVIASVIEHSAELESFKAWEKEGWLEYTLAPVDKNGLINTKEIKELIQENTALISVMYANNEIGTIQDIRALTKMVRHYKKHSLGDPTSIYPMVHTDAIQAISYLPINILKLGVDAFTISGSKIYGPKGIAAFYLSPKIKNTKSMLHGGDQEFGLRPGTQDVASVIGLADALGLVRADSNKEGQRLQMIQYETIEFLLNELKEYGVHVNGFHHTSESKMFVVEQKSGLATYRRLPNNIHMSFPGISGERLVIELDALGYAVSSRSACSTDSIEGSHVLKAIGIDDHDSHGSLRISMGRTTTRRQMECFSKDLIQLVKRIYAEHKKYQIQK